MTALGPRTEAALKDGPQFVDGALVALADGRTLRSRAPESLESFARRVALIAHAEGFAAGARAQREMEPTEEMCFAGGAAVAENGGEGTQHEQRGDALAAYIAMQRVAPLVGGGGDGKRPVRHAAIPRCRRKAVVPRATV